MLVMLFMHLFKLSQLFMKDDNYHQQTPPSLTFAHPWAMPNLAMDQEFKDFENIDATPQKYACIQSWILLQIKIHRSDFQTYPYYLQPWGFLAFTWILSNWKIERSSQALCLKFFGLPLFRSFLSFQNKTQRFHCMTVSSLSHMWYLWILTKAMNDVMPFLLL